MAALAALVVLRTSPFCTRGVLLTFCSFHVPAAHRTTLLNMPEHLMAGSLPLHRTLPLGHHLIT